MMTPEQVFEKSFSKKELREQKLKPSLDKLNTLIFKLDYNVQLTESTKYKGSDFLALPYDFMVDKGKSTLGALIFSLDGILYSHRKDILQRLKASGWEVFLYYYRGRFDERKTEYIMIYPQKNPDLFVDFIYGDSAESAKAEFYENKTQTKMKYKKRAAEDIEETRLYNLQKERISHKKPKVTNLFGLIKK